MTVAAFGAKAAVAVLLLVAGGAKLADLAGFAAAVRLFVPARAAALPLAGLPAAAALASAELAAGGASLCWPAAGWLNVLVLVLACGFCAVALLGYVRHRGRPCRCFGALTRRSFGARNIGQTAVILAAAILATRSASPAQLGFGLGDHLLLLAGAGVVVLAAFTAARALATGEAQPGLAT